MPLQELLLSQRKLFISLVFSLSFTVTSQIWNHFQNTPVSLQRSERFHLAPAYISQLLHHRTGCRPLRSSSQRLLSIPKTSLKTYMEDIAAFSATGVTNYPYQSDHQTP